MAKPVVMPKAGISVTSCIIGKWQKKIGDSVVTGDILFDYETDKATFECASTESGTLLAIFFSDGDEVPCLTPVCAIGIIGEDISELYPKSGAFPADANTAVVDVSAGQPDVTSPAKPVTGNGFVSPRARERAQQLHVEPGDATPTGPNGRVIARDIQTLFMSAKTGTGIGGRAYDQHAETEIPAAGASGAQETPAYLDEKLTQMRRTISKAMMNSLQSMAQLTHHHSCDATEIVKLRQQFKTHGEGLGLSAVSLNDMVLFAVSRTLKNHPDLNALLINGDIFRRFNGVHLGVAVDTPRGLMVPTIFDADKKSLPEISKQAKELAAACRSGRINPDLLQGGSFTVSNLGALGVEMFTPIINPPQVAILGVCGIMEKVRNSAGGIEIYQSIGLSITYDHRAVDGAPASRFVQELASNLEHFQLLLAL